MATDFRHKPTRRKAYQRKSQLKSESSTQSGDSGLGPLSATQLLWLAGLLLTVLLVAAFFIVQHFASEGVKGSEKRASTVYKTEFSELTLVNPSVERPVERPKETTSKNTSDGAPTSDTPIEVETHYTFYTDLPNTQVVVDVEPLPIELPEPMWIQAGSFRELSQAQREQRRLSNNDRQVDIAPINTQNGRYYRIMLGPYTDRLIMNQQRNQLRRLGADTRVVRIKPDVAED